MRMNWTQENLDVGMNNLAQMNQAAEVNDLDIQVTNFYAISFTSGPK